MSREVYRFRFGPEVQIDALEETLLLAVLAVEGLHGRSTLHLDAAFRLDKTARTCTVDGDSAVGRDLARIFTQYLAREFGEAAFTVERVTTEATD